MSTRSKKPRGLRRHFKRLTENGLQLPPLCFASLERVGYCYYRIGLAPWSGHSYASNPPGRFRQLVVRELLATFSYWQTRLASSPAPSYLAVWVMDSCFRDSQVVAAVGRRMGYYEHLLGAPAPAAPPLPVEYARLPGAEKLAWTAYYLEEAVWPEELPARTPAHLYREAATEAGEAYYLLRRAGHVWVGRAPRSEQQLLVSQPESAAAAAVPSASR